MAATVDLPAWATWAVLAATVAVGAGLAWVGARFRAASRAASLAAGPGSEATGAAPWLEHVSELRRRLVRAVLAWVVALAVVLTVRLTPAAPWVDLDIYDNLAAQLFRRLAHDLVPSGVQLVVLSPTAGLVVQFTLGIGLAVFLTLPYVLAQLLGFFAPALRDRERRVILALLLPILALFLTGVAFAYVFVLPTAFSALYAFSGTLGAETFLDVGEFVSFTTMFLLLVGAAFQLPLVMYAMARVGIVGWRAFRSKWRHALVGILVLTALLTPDPTPVSQVLLAAPLVGLYLLGVALAARGQKRLERA